MRGQRLAPRATVRVASRSRAARVVLAFVLAATSMMIFSGCASGGLVSVRRSALQGMITVEQMQMTVDTLVRNACPRLIGDDVTAEGVLKVRVLEDPFDSEIRARVTRSSGDLRMDQSVTELVSQLTPRFREARMQMYTQKYDVQVHYSCGRDSYGVTGQAAVEL